jgi:hypothetical protein
MCAVAPVSAIQAIGESLVPVRRALDAKFESAIVILRRDGCTRERITDCERSSGLGVLALKLVGHATCVSSVPKDGEDPRRSGRD